MGRLAAIVIAGGASRRFGSDKLELRDDTGRTLVEVVVAGATEHADPVVVVGPMRDIPHSVIWVREEPAGGGPGAALIAGVRALPPDAERVMVLAADSPRGPDAIAALMAAMDASGAAAATLVDRDRREQPITTLYDVAALKVVAEAYGDGGGMSVRRILDDLRPSGVVGVPDEFGAADDVDRPEDARRLGLRLDP